MKSMRRAALQIGLVALTLSVVALLSSSASGVSGDSETAGPKFVVACTQNGQSAQGGGVGSLTCVLKVTNLPAPLEDEVVVLLSSTVIAEEGPTDVAPSSGTNVSAAAPDTELGGPGLVSRTLAPVLRPPPPVVPQVPTRPPKAL